MYDGGGVVCKEMTATDFSKSKKKKSIMKTTSKIIFDIAHFNRCAEIANDNLRKCAEIARVLKSHHKLEIIKNDDRLKIMEMAMLIEKLAEDTTIFKIEKIINNENS